MLSPKEGWLRMKWKLYAKVQRPEKGASSWEEGLSSLPKGEWAVAESQKGMAQDKVKLVCRCTTAWKTSIFLRGKVELFTGGWVSCCWVPKRDDAKNEKNDYKADEGNRKGKYRYLFWCNFWCIRKIFHSLLNTYKGSYKLLIISRVSCSDEFFIKRLILSQKKKKKRKGLIPLISNICTIMNSFVLLLMVHEATRYTRYQS